MQESNKIKDLCKKWNSICTSVHRKPHFLEKVFNVSSSSPSSSTSVSSNGHHKSKIHKNLLSWQTIFENEGEVSKPELLSNPNSSPNSASSSEASEELMELRCKFDELSSGNVKILSGALEKKVPWQRDIIPGIVTTVLKCRSKKENRHESWLFFLGADSDGKEIVAKELAKAVFGSHDDSFVAIGISRFSSTRADSTEEVSNGNKRGRNEHGGSVFDRFSEAVRLNPSRVFFIEDADQLDSHCQRGFEKAIKDGSVAVDDGDDVLLKDAIVIFSSESFSCESRACSPPATGGKREKEERESSGVLDLNMATEDDDNEDGILGSVDMQVVFKVEEAL